MRFILIGIFIIIACIAGCGPTEEQRKEIYNNGYTAGYQSAKTVFYLKGKTDGHKLAMAKCDTLVTQSFLEGQMKGYTEGEKDGYKQARKEEFQFQIIDGLRLSWTKAIVILILSFIGLLVFSVTKDLYFQTLRESITRYIQEKRWEVEGRFNRKRRIEVEKGKWKIEKEFVAQKEVQIENQVDNIQTNNSEAEKFISKGMPDHQLKMAKRLIKEGNERIKQLEKIKAFGKIHLQKIEKINNGLDFELYTNENVTSFDIHSLIAESTDLSRKIKFYLQFDIQDFNSETYDEFIFHHVKGDEFMDN